MTGWDSYLDAATLPYPFCPGCGHGTVVDSLDRALVKLQLEPSRVVVVTDIGCSGLADRHLVTHAVHGLHGRSITYATGLKLADPGLTVIVIMGDGGCGIGGAHLLAAARRNIGVTVLVLNNMNFGMTGGQHSATTPEGAITATTSAGNLERPLDICATVGVNGAAFAARKTTWDRDLTDVLVDAIQTPGFALVDVWELCTAYLAPNNRLNRGAVAETLVRLGMGTGVLYQRAGYEYAAAVQAQTASSAGALPQSWLIEQRHVSKLARPLSMIIAGSAGGKVRSAALAVGRGAVLSGLWASQRDDYPVTVMSGHSVAEITLSPEPIHHTGVSSPDVLVALTGDGLRAVRSHVAHLGPQARLYWNTELGDVESAAQVMRVDVREAGVRPTRENLAMLVAAGVVVHEDLFPLEAMAEAVGHGQREQIAQESRAAIAAGRILAQSWRRADDFPRVDKR